MADPLAHQVLEREGVADFILAPQLAQQAAGELQAVSRYLDTQHSVRDRPRLFAWLATHGFGRQLLAGRTGRTGGTARMPRRKGPSRRAAPPPAPPARPPTPHAAVWDDVRDRLRADSAAAEIQVWLDDLVLLDLTGTAAIVGTPNVFVRDLVQPHAAALAAGLAQVVGHRVDVTAVVDGCR